MISHELSLIQERSADRAMIEAATAEFLQRGEIQVLEIVQNRNIALNDFKTGAAFEDRVQVRERIAQEQRAQAKVVQELRPAKKEVRKRSKGPTVREIVQQQKAARVEAKKEAREILLAKVSELAKTMTKAQVSRALGITISQIRILCRHHYLPFRFFKAKEKVPNSHYIRLAKEMKAYRDAGYNRAQVRTKMKIGTTVFNRILEVSGMTYPLQMPALKIKEEA